MEQVDGLVHQAGQRRYQLVERRKDRDDLTLPPRVPQRSSGITQSGLSPRATRCTLSKAFRKALVQFSHVGPAECGVNVTFSRPKSGWLMRGGSSTITSRPAAAICLESSAWRSASSSTTGPRHVLMKMASFFIMANSRAPIILRV